MHVHCAASGLARPPLRPIFEPARVTIQPFQWGFACYQCAMLGVLEATSDGDADKNHLCAPIQYRDRNADYPAAFLATLAIDRACAAYPAVASWAKSTRLNPMSGLPAHRDDPSPEAVANLRRVAGS